MLCDAQPPFRYGVKTLSSRDLGLTPRREISRPVAPKPAEPEVVATPEVVVEPGVTIEPEIVTEPEIVVEPEITVEPAATPTGLEHYPPKIIKALEENNISTMAGLLAFLETGTLESLPKIGVKMEQTILAGIPEKTGENFT